MTTISLPHGQLQEWLGIHRAKGAHDDVLTRPTRVQIALWGALLVTTLMFFFSGYDKWQIGVYPDEAQYIVLARSLVHSSQYGLINYPGQPHLANYPFGYPLLLVPLVLLWPDNLDALRIVSLLATLLNVALLFWGWRWLTRSFSYWWGLAVAGLYALAPLVVKHSWMVMSEAVFLTFCLIAMILTEQAARGQQGRFWGFWMGLALMFVLFTRTVGIVLVGSIVLYLLVVRQRAILRLLLVALVGIGFWVALVVAGTSFQAQQLLPVKYADEAVSNALSPISASSSPASGGSRLLSRLSFFIKQNLAIDVREAILPLGGGEAEEQFLSHVGATGLSLVIGLALCAVLALGFMRAFRREGASIFLLFVIPYAAMLVVWVWMGGRLLYPIEPQLFLCLLLGVEALGGCGVRFGERIHLLTQTQRFMLPNVVVFLLVLFSYKSVKIDDARWHVGDIAARSSWLKANAQPGDIVMTEHPEVDYLHAELKTVNYPANVSRLQSDDFSAYLAQQNVRYLLLAPHAWWQSSYVPSYDDDTKRLLFLAEALSAQHKLQLVYAEDRTLIKIYKVLP